MSASKTEEPLISGKSSKHQLICDLSVPRNIDPAVGKNTQVQLMNIEMINRWIDERKKSESGYLALSEEHLWNQVIRQCQIYRDRVLQGNSVITI